MFTLCFYNLGNSKLVVFPRTTLDVSNILKYCHEQNVTCVVQSGNTSLVAGSVPVDDEVIISMRRMNKIISFDDAAGVLQCEAGCILEHLETLANEHGRTVPYDLGAKGSCLIGGNLATNAGGLRFIRYGPLYANVLGLEVVLPDGQVLDLMSSMRKDNTGYHLKNLFIGSEGTLGIITKVSMLCPIRSHTRIAVLCSLGEYKHILELYRRVQGELNEYLTCFEMMDAESMLAVNDNLAMANPFGEDSSFKFYSLFEVATNDPSYVETKLIKLLSQLETDNIVQQSIHVDDNQSNKFTKLKAYRESITEALRRDGHAYKYDISLPLAVYYDIVEKMRDRLADQADCVRVCGYGHLGDSNLHLNVTSRIYKDSILALIEPYIYQFVAEHRGSISAEHGIGIKKRQYLECSKPTEAIELMARLKRMIDTKAILNPGKVLP